MKTLRTISLTLAAEQGEAKAQFNLGVMYDNGEGSNPIKDAWAELSSNPTIWMHLTHSGSIGDTFQPTWGRDIRTSFVKPK